LFWKKSSQPEALEIKPNPKSPKPEYIDSIVQLDRAAVKGAVFARCSPLLFGLAISGPLLNPTFNIAPANPHQAANLKKGNGIVRIGASALL
jgi:hypothetical protein